MPQGFEDRIENGFQEDRIESGQDQEEETGD
jgi:hypothetical protein